MNFFKSVLAGLEKPIDWIKDGLQWLPRILAAGKEVEVDAKPVIAEITTICKDVDAIVGTGAQDFAEFMVAAKPLWQAVLLAAGEKGLNVTLDLALIPDIQSAIANAKTFENEFAKLETLAADWKKLSATITADVARLKGDLDGQPNQQTVANTASGAATIVADKLVNEPPTGTGEPASTLTGSTAGENPVAAAKTE